MSGLYKKAGSTFILKFFGLSIVFIFQIVLGRVLNPELYGEYTMYLTYSSVFSIITILGMDRNLIKEVARYEGDGTKEKLLLRFSTQISLLITIVVFVVLLLLRGIIGFSHYGLLLLLAMIVIRSIIAILDGYLQGKGNVVQVTLMNSVINNILKMIFFVVFVFLNIESLTAAIFSFVLSEIVTIILRTTQISKILKITTNSMLILSSEEKRTFIKYSLTVALISGIGLMLQNIDKIMISAYLDLNRVGIYKVAQNYVSLISVFVTPFIAFWPVISKLYNENNIGQIEIEMKRIVRIVTYLVIPMFFIFLFLSNDLLAIFGEAYVTEEAELSLIILAFSFLIDAVSGPIGSILTMTKYAKLALYNNIASLLINISLNLILIGRFGIVGVAIATGISIIANNLISIIQVRLFLGVFSYDYRNLTQILLMGIVNYLIGPVLKDAISTDNMYFRIIIFGITIYGLNLIIVAFTQREHIYKILDRRHNMEIIIKITKRCTLFFINVLLLIVSFIIPKSHKMAIVGGWFGKRFADNSKHFYLYMSANLSNIGFEKVVWITRSKEIETELKKQGYQVYTAWSLPSIWYHFRAKYHLIDQSQKDINSYFSIRSKRINLWHGFPLKKVGTFMGELAYSDRSSLGQFLYKITSRGFWADHYVLATSEFAAKIQGRIFGLVDEKVIISGYPRNYESYVSNPIKYVPDKELKSLKEIENYKKMGYKIIGYFPTFRDKRETLIFGTNDSSIQVRFLDFCESLKIKVVGKFHFAGKNDKIGEISNHEAFINLPSDADVYTFINDINILITDYSSIFYDFLLWERPIIFFPYDLEYYSYQDRGLMFDYNEYTPGPKVRNLGELKEVLINPDFEQIYSNKYSKAARELTEKVFANYREMDINHLVNEIRKI